jgi:hypothetical protein
MKKQLIIGLCVVSIPFLTACEYTPDSDEIQTEQQEKILQEGTAQTGMPAIKNFRERKIMKMLLEMRDQENLNTYTYTYAEASGEIKFFCNSVGFAIPYSTQYTNPQKLEYEYGEMHTIPQADPSGLFSPESADASWVMCKSPDGKISPTYVEPKVIVSTYKL